MVATLTNVDIEDEIMRLSGEMESATYEYATLSDEAAQAEVDYKLDNARELLKAEAPNQAARTAKALIQTREQFETHRIAEARLKAQAELLRTLHARLDALRTLAANLRSQT